MTCPIDARLAAAASGEDAGALAHARECLRCRVVLQDQRAAIAVAQQWPALALRPQRRAALAAEVMAASDVAGTRWRDTRVLAAAAIVALAAGIVLVATGTREASPQDVPVPELAILASVDEPTVAIEQRTMIEIDAPVRTEPRAISVHEGTLPLDTRAAEPVTIVAGDTRVVVADARASIVAHDGVIVSAQVFAGSVEITRGATHVFVDAGNVWTRPAKAATTTPPREAPPQATGADASLAAFRSGWEALRLARFADAIAAFDRASDPVVAEDAAFWAAIASERAGDRAEAARRLDAFIARFPASPRIEAARGALERVRR